MNPLPSRRLARSLTTVGVCLAVAAALSATAARDASGRDRDRDLAVRLTRTGLQRLDAADVVPHGPDNHEPSVVHAGLVVSPQPAASTPGDGLPGLPAAATPALPGPASGRLAAVAADGEAEDRRALQPPGRAPPARA